MGTPIRVSGRGSFMRFMKFSMRSKRMWGIGSRGEGRVGIGDEGFINVSNFI